MQACAAAGYDASFCIDRHLARAGMNGRAEYTKPALQALCFEPDRLRAGSYLEAYPNNSGRWEILGDGFTLPLALSKEWNGRMIGCT